MFESQNLQEFICPPNRDTSSRAQPFSGY